MITLPVIAVVTPVASLAVGNLLLGESAQLGVLSGAVAALAVLVTSAGLVVLARLTTGQPGPVRGRGSSVILPAIPGVRFAVRSRARPSRRGARRAPVTRARPPASRPPAAGHGVHPGHRRLDCLDVPGTGHSA